MTMRKAFDDADDIIEGIKGRRPTQSKPTKVVDDLNGVVIISKGEAQQAKRASRAADIEEVRVKKVLEKEERRKSAEQLKVLGQDLLASGVASREILPKLAQSIIVDLGLRLVSNEWEIKSAEEATKVAKIWYDILRLESGQATTINENRTGNPEDRLSRLEELRSEAKARVEAGLRLGEFDVFIVFAAEQTGAGD
jgi:hypothetical protein